MTELVDVADLKSAAPRGVQVRSLPRAPLDACLLPEQRLLRLELSLEVCSPLIHRIGHIVGPVHRSHERGERCLRSIGGLCLVSASTARGEGNNEETGGDSWLHLWFIGAIGVQLNPGTLLPSC